MVCMCHTLAKRRMTPGKGTTKLRTKQVHTIPSHCSLYVVVSQRRFCFCHNVEELSRDERARAIIDLDGRISHNLSYKKVLCRAFWPASTIERSNIVASIQSTTVTGTRRPSAKGAWQGFHKTQQSKLLQPWYGVLPAPYLVLALRLCS